MVRRSLSILVLALLAACSDDETAPIDVGPTGDPTIAFKAPAASDTPVCATVGEEPDARLPLVMDVQEFVLRPPGSCGLLAQCGHLELYTCPPRGCQEPVMGETPTLPVLNNESPVRSIDLLLGRLADRYHDNTLHADTNAPDLLHVRVDVVDDAGALESDHEGQPLRAELALMTLPGPCCANLASDATASQSGVGGAPDTWNDGGVEAECSENCACGGLVNNDVARGAWVQYDWPSAVTIGSMWLDTGNCSSCSRAGVASGKVQYWDGSGWQTAQSFADKNDDFGLSFTPAIKTTKLRVFDVAASTCGPIARKSRIYEWYVYPGIGCQP